MEYLVIFGYFAALLAIGVAASRRVHDADVRAGEVRRVLAIAERIGDS